MNIYLIYAYGWDWHRVIATRLHELEAINLAKETPESIAPRGCSVWAFEIDGGEGKKIYPDWS